MTMRLFFVAAAFSAALAGLTPAHAESGVRDAAIDGRTRHSMAPKKADPNKADARKAAGRADKKKAGARKKDHAEARKQTDRTLREARIEAAKRAETKQRIAQAKLDKERARFGARRIEGDVEAAPVTMAGNSGELRSESQQRPVGLFAGLFGGGIQPSMLAETRALDGALENRQRNKKFRVKADFEPQSVAFSGYERGTIVVDTSSRYLYLVESSRSARRYAIAVGREGLAFTGTAKVGDKQEWPRWIPTKEMQEREPRKYGQYKDGMNGGPDNPLGARAIYLYQGRKDTHIRIHGTNQPETIGTASSNGCFRMVNEHVMDLYGRVRVGTNVVVVQGLG